LLIAFFIFTTQITKPTVTKLVMPRDGEVTNIPESRALTILLGKDENLFYYFGTEEEAFQHDQVFSASYSVYEGIGRIIREKQDQLDRLQVGKKELIVLIKPGNYSSYKRVVDILDEMLINDVRKYSIVEPGKWDQRLLN
jgi:hypothetical protein